MSTINTSRVLLGGLLCGLIINIGEFLLNGVVLATQWEELNKAMNKPALITTDQIVLFNVWGFIAGIAGIWLYAAMRPRFGAGPKTAACAGLALWFTAWFLGSAGFWVTGWLPDGMWGILLAWGLVEAVVATVAGAAVYKEEAAHARTASA